MLILRQGRYINLVQNCVYVYRSDWCMDEFPKHTLIVHSLGSQSSIDDVKWKVHYDAFVFNSEENKRGKNSLIFLRDIQPNHNSTQSKSFLIHPLKIYVHPRWHFAMLSQNTWLPLHEVMNIFLRLFQNFHRSMFFLDFANLVENLHRLGHFRIYSNKRVFHKIQVSVKKITHAQVIFVVTVFALVIKIVNNMKKQKL